jgi:starvation-inducible DNA-binding protein
MNATATPTNIPGLGTHVREEVGNTLQATLVELIDLSLIGKQLHWNIVGPRFRSLHLHLDELVDSWHELSDTVAERAVAIGHSPDGQAAAVAGSAGLKPVHGGLINDDEVVRVLTQRVEEVGARVRDRMDRLGELDAASQDVLTEVVRELEKQLWMIRAQLAGGV